MFDQISSKESERVCDLRVNQTCFLHHKENFENTPKWEHIQFEPCLWVYIVIPHNGD